MREIANENRQERHNRSATDHNATATPRKTPQRPACVRPRIYASSPRTRRLQTKQEKHQSVDQGREAARFNTHGHEVNDEVGNLVGFSGEVEVALELQGLVPLAHALVVLHRLGRHLVPPHGNTEPPGANTHTRTGKKIARKITRPTCDKNGLSHSTQDTVDPHQSVEAGLLGLWDGSRKEKKQLRHQKRGVVYSQQRRRQEETRVRGTYCTADKESFITCAEMSLARGSFPTTTRT